MDMQILNRTAQELATMPLDKLIAENHAVSDAINLNIDAIKKSQAELVAGMAKIQSMMSGMDVDLVVIS